MLIYLLSDGNQKLLNRTQNIMCNPVVTEPL
jgi:hypothetical protein